MCDPLKPGFRQYGVTEWRNGLLTKDFSRVIKPSIRGRGAQVASAQAGAPKFVMRAGFVGAALANVYNGKAYFLF